jgi:hypothetical protein
MALSYRDQTIAAQGHLAIVAFMEIREELEQRGLLAWCNGASEDAFVSGMLMEFSSGLNVFRPLGTHGEAAVVSIFGSDSGIVPISVAEQRRRWGWS